MSRHLSSGSVSMQTRIITNIKEGKTVERKYTYATNKDMDVDVGFFFSCLPTNSEKTDGKYVKKLLCVPALNKVVWRMPSPLLLREVIDELEPVVYRKNRIVGGSKKPIDIILFIVDGVIVKGPNADVASSIGEPRYERGDIFGEEIFSSRSQPAPPLISDRDYRCETKVEAFKLTYEKWRILVSNYEEEEAVVYSHQSHLILLNKAYMKLTTTRWEDIEKEMTLRMNLKREGIEDQKLQKTKKSIKEIDILDWLSRNGFSNDAKTNIMKHIKVISGPPDDDVNIKYLLSHPPQATQMTIRKQLGMKSLTKVPMLQNMDDSLLSIMCEKYLQPEIYCEKNHLVQAGKAIGLMFIIIEGTVIAGSSRLLKKGDFYGEPLLSWASPNNLFSGPVPISSEDVICHTKVEVLELKVNPFRSLVADFSSQWISNFNMCGDSQQLNENLAIPYCNKINIKSNKTYKQLESKEVSQLIEDRELRNKMKIILKENEILDWVSSASQSEDITTQIKRIIKISKVVEGNIDVDVNLEYVLSILPSDIKQLLKEHICIRTLKKVPILKNVDEDLLNCICLNLQPVIIPQDHYIIKTGEKLDRMIIVVKGVVICTATSTQQILKNGEYWFGDEILSLAFPHIFSPPISSQDVMCQTKVEALALTVKGLENVLANYKDIQFTVEDLPPIVPLGLQSGDSGGVLADDNGVSSSSTTIDQRLDQLLQLQVSARDEMAKMSKFLAKLGYDSTPPRVLLQPRAERT